MLNERKMRGWMTACIQGDMSLWLHSMRTSLMLGVHPADELYAGSQQCNDDRHVWI